MKLISIPVLADNYIWLLTDSKNTIIIDPGAAKPVINILQKMGQVPDAILLTHHHDDHTAGVADLVSQYPDITVYGPEETRNKGAQKIVTEGTSIQVGHMQFQVIATPGHTLGHVAYYHAPYLFCGDTLFSAGCGRIFEGTPEQMYHSLQKLAALPDDTLVCCAHEYTLSNLRFAHSILPNDNEINQYLKQVEDMRDRGQSTLPSNLALEKQINLFLRCNENIFIGNKAIIGNKITPLMTFTELRHRKNLG